MKKNKENSQVFTILKIIFILFFVFLIGKFLLVTVYYQNGFKTMASNQTEIVVKNPMPRGEIFDRKSRLIVGNKQEKKLIYINNGNVDNQKMWNLAKWISRNINCESAKKDIRLIDYKDLFIQENSDILNKRLKKIDLTNVSSQKLLEIERDKVTKQDIESLKEKHGETVVAIKLKMQASSSTAPQTLAENLTVKEQYFVNTNLGKLGGSFLINNWVRNYPYKETMRSTLGKVGEIPKEKQEEYLNKGYNKNDLVGTSYIENNLDSSLKSTDQLIQLYYDSNGNIKNYKTLDQGKEGLDIKLTIDIKLQNKVEKIIKRYLKTDNYQYFKNAFSSIVDPKTGEILVMGGIEENKKNYYDYSIGQFTTSYEVGSVVKPGILLAGYKNGWAKNKVINDAPIKLGNTTKSSYHNYGPINEYQAIQVSSNIYFYDIVLKMAGINYNSIDTTSLANGVNTKYFTKVRRELQKLGLGSSTGIDFANEETGVVNSDNSLGLYMDIANGQYDTYTPLQLTQYISTLANGQERLKMNYIKSINQAGNVGKLGKLITSSKVEILNVLDNKREDVKHVKDTLKMPSTTGGTTHAAADTRYKIGSKSGTSESFYYEPGMKEAVKTDNSSFIAYAPYKNPKIALSVLMPYWTPDGEVEKASAVNAGGEILKECYKEGYIN